MIASHDPVLTRLRDALSEEFGDRLGRVVLYGSRARGDATASSDYDVAVFLTTSAGLWRESASLAEIETAILFDMGAVVNVLPFPSNAYQALSPLMHELRRDGLDL